MTFPHIFSVYLVVAGLITAASAAQAQAQPQTQTQKQVANCPPVSALKAPQFYGLWAVHFTQPPAGLPARATMLLERHAEFADSLAGTVSRDLGPAAGSKAVAAHAAKAALAGDFEDGMLLLDESSDNVSITGTWNGELVAGSCGKAFKGTWKDTSSSAPADAPDIPFTLTRLP